MRTTSTLVSRRLPKKRSSSSRALAACRRCTSAASKFGGGCAQAAQHAYWTPLSEPEMVGDRVRFSDAIGLDALRDLGFGALAVDSDAVIDEDARIRSL